MEREIKLLAPENLPLELGDFGIVTDAQIVMPGVYEAVLMQEEVFVGAEAFIINRDTPEISGVAKQYGQAIPEYPALLLYREDSVGNPCCIINYELTRYKILHQLPLAEAESIREIAAFGAEQYPGYFGDYPVPIFTPWGRTTRHKVIANGLYWLETEHCQQGLAVAYPQYDDLSDGARGLSTEFDDGLSLPGGQVPGYLFFSKVDSSVPLFELTSAIPEAKLTCQIKHAELMNDIYQNHPEYVALYNAAEQAGLNDRLGMLLNAFGIETELSSSIDGMIKLSPEIGTDFIAF